MNKYDDIIDLPHHVSTKRKQMSLENRAAQFAPFAALEGHEDVLSETARQTNERLHLSQFETDRLAEKLLYCYETGQSAIITYFMPDKAKNGGEYKSISGMIKNIDEINLKIIMKNGMSIPLKDIYSIKVSGI